MAIEKLKINYKIQKLYLTQSQN